MASGYSVSLPLTKSPRDGLYNLNQTLKQTVAQNLKTVIFTAPGERVMDLNFGVGIRNYLFEPLTDNTVQTIRDNISTQISKYLPFVLVEDLVFFQSEEANLLSIQLSYTFSGVNLRQTLDLKIQ